MYSAKDYRKQAWGTLRGHWGVMAISQLIYLLITLVCGALSYYVIGAIVLILVSGPIELGIYKMSLYLLRGEKVEIPTLFSGFKDMSRAIILWLTNYILIGLWALLLIIPGIIKKYSYSMSYFVLLDNPNMTANEARKRSMELMKGNKWRLFCLHLSYIGWILLSVITFGILYLWVLPSIRTAEAAFYKSLLPEEEKSETFDGGFEDVIDVDVEPFESSKNDDITF
ncbi:MAG: DUF975 family protein [Clostridia bacterium]|nr:DUF975 family protein [Clostridia bacterium]MDE7329157.1 DUF975 family protein [Clostridia bacterium]